MKHMVLRRLVLAVFVLFSVVSLTYLVLNATGDPIANRMREAGASQAQIDAARHELGLDRPLLVRFADYWMGILQGDFGTSIQYGRPTLPLVMDRVPFTLWLAGAALLITVLVGVPLGVLAATRRGTLVDRIVVGAAAGGQSVPSFVVGPILILFFAVQFGWFPVAGSGSWSALVLPAVTLAVFPTARVVRLVRSSMLDVAGADFVTTARAKGQREGQVVYRHILRNALLPVLTVVALQVTQMLGGAVVVESIFGWPGIGSFARDALINSDFPLAQTIVILTATAVVTVNFLTDLAYSVIDPRVRLT